MGYRAVLRPSLDPPAHVPALLIDGVQAKAIQEQLNHSSIVVTMDVYGSLFPDEAEGVANAMEETYHRATAGGSTGGTVRPIRSRGR